MESLFTGLGLVGVVVVLVAYGLLTSGRLRAEDVRYPLLNLLGALLLLVSLIAQWNLAGFIANSMWFLIALVSLWRLRRQGRRWN
jgi:hypothetical protein